MILRIAIVYIATAIACLMFWALVGVMIRQIDSAMELHRNFTAPSAYAPEFYDVR